MLKNHQYKILILEDSEEDRHLLKRLLHKIGFNINFTKEARSIKEAQTILKENQIDIILVDFFLPDGNGLDFTKTLNTDPTTKPVAIIALTTNDDRQLAIEWMKSGAHDFLIKNNAAAEALSHSIQHATDKVSLLYELTYIANHDSLTNAVTRHILIDRLQVAIESHSRNNKQFSVIFIDVDNFKSLNDCYGHTVGDQALKELVDSICSVIRASDTIGRLGGDEFLIIIEDSDTKTINFVLHKLLTAVKSLPLVDKKQICLNISLGVATFPKAGRSPSELISAADQAMYEAKHQSHSVYSFYDEKLARRYKRQVTIDRLLQTAINNRELFLAFQPIVDHNTLNPRHFECLCRWNSPRIGIIPPNEFIPRIPSLGLLDSFNQWLIPQALSEFSTLYKGDKKLKLALNFSNSAIMRPYFKQLLLTELGRLDLPTTVLELEISESELIDNFDSVCSHLQELRKLGISIAIDDFGAGYYSFRYLSDLPVDTVKIDKQFLVNVPKNQRHCDVIIGMMALCQGLNLTVVIEGVETKMQLDFIKSLNHGLIQGFFLGKPEVLGYYQEQSYTPTHIT